MAGIQSIRDGLDGVVTRLIVAVIIVAFVGSIGWSVFFSSSDASVVASVDDYKVDISDLTFEMQSQNFYLKQRFQDEEFELEDEVLAELSLESLLRKASILNFMDQSGAGVTDTMAHRQLAEDQNYQENGTYSVERFNSIARSQGFVPDTYLRRIKHDIAMGYWQKGISSGSFVSDSEIEKNIDLAEQTRDVSYVRFNLEDFINTVTLDEAKLLGFYQKNSQLFQSEETATVEFIQLAASDLRKDIVIDEENIQREYDLYLENFDNSVRRSVSHVMIDLNENRNLKEANDLLISLKDRIDRGESFDSIVREFSDDSGTKESGGDLGLSDGSVFPPEFEEALISLQKGEISQPIALDESMHLLKLTDIEIPAPESFDKKGGSIKDNLIQDLLEERFVVLLDEASELSYTFNDIETIAKELGLARSTATYITRSSEDTPLNSKKIKDLIFNNNEIQEGVISEVTEVSEDLAFIIEVKDFKPQQTKKYKEVKKQVSDLYKRYEAESELKSSASNFIDALNQGGILESLAAKKNKEVTVYKALTRNSSLLPNNTTAQIFTFPRSSAGKQFQIAKFSNGDSIVFRLDAINENVSNLSDEDRENFRSYIASERTFAELNELQEAAFKSAEITRKTTQKTLQ
jgi:peptidyl-prolyl cis-trans isomerase D